MSFIKIIPLICLLAIACNNAGKKQKKAAGPVSTTSDNSIRVINNIDTAKYIPVSNGFYKTAAGDIFELKFGNEEDSSGWYMLYYLDSTIIVGDHTDRKALKDFIDPETLEQDSISDFSKDRRYVYYVLAQSGGQVRFVVPQADAKTFTGLGNRYGRDRKNVFYMMEVLKGADVKTFRVYGETLDSARDKNHIYYSGEIQ